MLYCGRGSLKRCRSALRRSLLTALTVSKKDLYGKSADCRTRAEASCFDQNRFIVASGIPVDDFPFQNRPTFQQVVELTRHAPR